MNELEYLLSQGINVCKPLCMVAYIAENGISCNSYLNLNCEKCRCHNDRSHIAKVLLRNHTNPTSRDEKILLKQLDQKYRYIARKKNNNMAVFTASPEKNADGDWDPGENGRCLELECYNHLFKFIRSDDCQAYTIADLTAN